MRQELFHHANRPAQIDFNLSSDVFEASSFVVNIDLTHDAGVVDQNVELRKLCGDLFVKGGDRFRIGNVALKSVNFWKRRFRTVQLSLIAARDKNRVTKCRELFGEFVTDAAGTAGDQNRIAREFHNSGLRPCVCRSGLVGKPFTKQVRLHLPRKRSGHEGVQYAVQPAWNDSGAVFEQTVEALRYALLDAERFHRHGLRIEAELFKHRCVRKPGCQHSDVDAQRFELIVKRFAKAVYIGLPGSVIRHTGNAVFRTHCPREDQTAPPPLGEFRAETVDDVQMRHRLEPQHCQKQLPIKLQELARISGAGIGDDKADVEIVSGGGELPHEILPNDIKHDDSMLPALTPAKFNASLLKQILPPPH